MRVSSDLTGCADGFQPLFRTSPFLDTAGPFFHRPDEDGFIIALRVQDKHTNASGTLHGGLIATLADISLGYVTALSQTPPLRLITTSLGVDFVGTARKGDWVESRVRIVKPGKRLAFANAMITAAGAPLASVRAVFSVLDGVV